MQNNYNEILGENWIYKKHPSGLNIYIVKKPGKSRICAQISTRFGSVNRMFCYGEEQVVVPNGTAHFLEHKLFEGKNGNAFDFYAKTGAKANAYTSNDKTAYYFTCSDKFEQNLDILLSFVSSPFLTDENVEKEKGIIGQEIRMYEDDPGWQGYFGLIENLYSEHPVKYDIAGSVEDIAPITVDTLMSCYNTFYDPSNMALCISGDIDENVVFAAADKYFKPSEGKVIKQVIPDEPCGIVREFSEKKMPVARPLFNIGIKDNNCSVVGRELVKKELATEMLLEIMFGQSTPFYKKLYDDGVINSEFDAAFECSETFGFCLFAGESDAPEKVLDAIRDEISGIFKNGISKKRFLQVRNTVYGNIVASLDNVSSIVRILTNSWFDRAEPFTHATVLRELTPDDLMVRAKELFENPDISMSVIKGE